MLSTPRLPFWRTVQADIARLREEDLGVRTLVRGVLSQGFHALFVYRVFRWCYERHIPAQRLTDVFNSLESYWLARSTGTPLLAG